MHCYHQAKKRMADLIQRIIQEKRRRIFDSEARCAPPRDAIDVLISDGSDELTDELISDNMIDLMIPAEDSVPVLITLAIKFLSECPLALQQLEVSMMYVLTFKENSCKLNFQMGYLLKSFDNNQSLGSIYNT